MRKRGERKKDILLNHLMLFDNEWEQKGCQSEGEQKSSHENKSKIGKYLLIVHT